METETARPVNLLGQVLSTVLVVSATVGGNVLVVPDLIDGARSERWPVVPGKIVPVPPRYWYAVGDQTYANDRVAFGAKDEAAHRYAEGQAVEVRYDPRQPDEAVLVPGIQSGPAAAFCILTAFDLLAAVMVFSLVQRLAGVKEPLFGQMVSDEEGYSFEPSKTPAGKAAGAAFLAGTFATIVVAMGIGAPAVALDWNGWIPVVAALVALIVVPTMVWATRAPR